MMDVDGICREMNDEIISWRRDLHKIPECGNDLPQTSAYVRAKLDAWGIRYQTFADHSGIVVLLGREGGKVIALRADMDALPVAEKTGLEFASVNGFMHACGHDAHTALLLGCCKFFKQHESSLKGQLKLIFQPGEEGSGGARIMASQGVLENPRVDAILGLHVGTFPECAKSGDIVIDQGSIWASSYDEVTITVQGKGSHAAEPDHSVDPIAIAQAIYAICQTVISREIPPYKSCVFTLANMHAGTGAFNIISDTACMTGTIRAQCNEDRDFIFNRVREIATGVAKVMRGACTVEFGEPVSPVINDRAITEIVLKAAEKVVPRENIKHLGRTLMAGEDASEFWERVPGTYFFLGTRVENQRPEAGMHHNEYFMLDETYLYRGAAVMIQAALDLLEGWETL